MEQYRPQGQPFGLGGDFSDMELVECLEDSHLDPVALPPPPTRNPTSSRKMVPARGAGPSRAEKGKGPQRAPWDQVSEFQTFALIVWTSQTSPGARMELRRFQSANQLNEVAQSFADTLSQHPKVHDDGYSQVMGIIII